MTGLLNPKSSEIGHLFCMSFMVYLGHGILHPVTVLNFLQISICGLRKVLRNASSSEIDNPQGKSGAPLS